MPPPEKSIDPLGSMVFSGEIPVPQTRFLRSKKGFGVESEAKMCLHIFVNERRSELARDVPSASRGEHLTIWGSSGENPLLLHQDILLSTNLWAISSAG